MMVNFTATERAIREMCNFSSRYRKGQFEEDVKEEGIIQAENLSGVVVKLQAIYDKASVEQINELLKYMFNSAILVRAIQRRLCV